jgi:cell wall assembly regulator SMI1
MASIAASWRLIEDVLCENAHSVFRALRKPVSEVGLRRMKEKLPAKLPNSFVQSLKIHDGLRNSYLGQIRLFDCWALLPVSAILRVWKMMTDLQAECGFGGDHVTKTPQIKNDSHWRSGWIPFMDAGDEMLVIDMDPGPAGKVGQVVVWSNSGSFPLRVLAGSFREWLAGVAAAFSKRNFRLDEFGGIWLDNDQLG